MNYEELSDFEINKRVALSLGESHFTSQCINFGCGESSVPVGFGNCMRNVDYCNNWADAGPVILESKIGIETTSSSCEWMARTCSTNMSNMMFRCCKHKNPLRAAMIVFLMIKDAEK